MAKNGCREIIQRLMQVPKPTSRDVNLAEMQVAQALNLRTLPPNSMLIRNLKPDEKKLVPILCRKHIRTISGVTIVAVMTKPYPCPKTTPCTYCLDEPTVGVPQSYTGFEPAAMRGIQNRCNPYRQVRSRINQLESIGHIVDKVELVIVGGTFPATSKRCLMHFFKTLLLKFSIKQKESNSFNQSWKSMQLTFLASNEHQITCSNALSVLSAIVLLHLSLLLYFRL